MVSSSKKKRGKQRKAAKSQAEDTKDLHLIHLCELDGRTIPWLRKLSIKNAQN